MSIDVTGLSNSLQSKIDTASASTPYSELLVLAKATETLGNLPSLQDVINASNDGVTDINDAASAQFNLIATVGSNQVGLVQTEGATQVDLVIAEGDNQLLLIQSAGTSGESDINTAKLDAIAAVISTGTTESQTITNTANTLISQITQEGNDQVALVTTEGDTQVARVQGVVGNLSAVANLPFFHSTTSPESHWKITDHGDGTYSLAIRYDGETEINVATNSSDNTILNDVEVSLSGVTYYRGDLVSSNAGVSEFKIAKSGTSQVEVLAGLETEILGLYGSLSNIDTLATNISTIEDLNTSGADLTTIATNITDITAVSNSLSDVEYVAANLTNITNNIDFSTVTTNTANTLKVLADPDGDGTFSPVEFSVASAAEFVATGAIASGDVVALRSDGTVEIASEITTGGVDDINYVDSDLSANNSDSTAPQVSKVKAVYAPEINAVFVGYYQDGNLFIIKGNVNNESIIVWGANENPFAGSGREGHVLTTWDMVWDSSKELLVIIANVHADAGLHVGMNTAIRSENAGDDLYSVNLLNSTNYLRQTIYYNNVIQKPAVIFNLTSSPQSHHRVMNITMNSEDTYYTAELVGTSYIESGLSSAPHYIAVGDPEAVFVGSSNHLWVISYWLGRDKISRFDVDSSTGELSNEKWRTLDTSSMSSSDLIGIDDQINKKIFYLPTDQILIMGTSGQGAALSAALISDLSESSVVADPATGLGSINQSAFSSVELLPSIDASYTNNTTAIYSNLHEKVFLFYTNINYGDYGYQYVRTASTSSGSLVLDTERTYSDLWTINEKSGVEINGHPFVIHQKDTKNLKWVSGVGSVPTTTTNAENWIGIAAEAIADGQSGAVSLKGDVNNKLSGLVTNNIYFVNSQGVLTTDKTSYGVVGRAISDTELVVLNSGSQEQGGAITNSDTSPTNPNEGDLWYDTSSGELYVYVVDVDSSQWVQPSLGATSLQVVNSINGQTGDVTIDAGVSSVNGQTGDVTVAAEKTVHVSEFTGASQSIDFDVADAFKSDISSDTSYSFSTTTSSNILLHKNILISNTTKTAFEIKNPEITSQASVDTFLANFAQNPDTWHPNHIKVKPDGTKLWIKNKVTAHTLPALYQYSMSTPWDLSTLTFDGTNSYGTVHNKQIYKFDFSSDWSVVVIYRYDSSAFAGDIWFYPGSWDASSATPFDMTNNIDPQDTNQGNDSLFWNTNSVFKFGTAGENVSGSTYYNVWNAMRSDFKYAFNSDCTKIITNTTAMGSTQWGIYELDLSGLSTYGQTSTGPVSIVSEVSTIDASVLGSDFYNYYMRPQSISPDGKTIFWASEWGYISGQWKLDIAYDLTSINLSRSFISIDSNDRSTDIISVAYSQDGTKAILMDRNENLVSYNSGGQFLVSYPGNAKLSADMPKAYGYGKKTLIEITSLDGGSNYYINPKVQNV